MPYLQQQSMNPKHWLCVIHACRKPAVACCHSRHGWHAYCDDHHFGRHQNDRPYKTPAGYLPPAPVQAPPTQPQQPPRPPQRPDIGPQPPVRPLTPPPPPTPTSGAPVAPPVPVPALAGFEF